MSCRAVAKGGGASQFLAKQLTLSQPGGQIMPTTVLRAPPDFQTLRRPCIALLVLINSNLLSLFQQVLNMRIVPLQRRWTQLSERRWMYYLIPQNCWQIQVYFYECDKKFHWEIGIRMYTNLSFCKEKCVLIMWI